MTPRTTKGLTNAPSRGRGHRPGSALIGHWKSVKWLSQLEPDRSVRTVSLDSRPHATGCGGGGGIRTHGGLAPTAVFKTAAFVHSATPPAGGYRIGSEISRR